MVVHGAATIPADGVTRNDRMPEVAHYFTLARIVEHFTARACGPLKYRAVVLWMVAVSEPLGGFDYHRLSSKLHDQML